MDIFLLLLRLTLTVVFAVAAFAKLFDPEGSRKALEGFGVPEPFRNPLVNILPVAELGIAIALLFVTSSWAGAVGAALLLIIFLGGMFYQLAVGNAPDCHCFGQLHNEPVGPSSVIRNLVLLAVAGFLVGQGKSYQGLSLVNSTQDILLIALGLGLLALLGTIAFLLKRISDQQNDISRRLNAVEHDGHFDHSVERDGVVHPNDGLPIGAKFPDFDLPGINGDIVTLDIIKTAKLPSLFFFISPTCTPCQSLVPEFEEWQTELKDKVNLVFVSSGTVQANEEKFSESIKRQLLIQKGRELADKAKAKWTPTAILVDQRGRVASHAAAGDNAIRDLVERIKLDDLKKAHYFFASSTGTETRNKIGQKIPDFSLQNIKGQEVNSDFFKGKTTLVTFWGLDCGHCKNFLDEFREWDRARHNGDLDMLVFSDGDMAGNSELGFNAPVIIDKGYKVAGKFGMFGTPSAVLVDESGTIISETAIGAPGIWALIGRES
mgnify:CR=1 FL=1